MTARDPSLELAERVHARLLALGVRTAVIGAFAMTAHGYQRETGDLDLALAVPLDELKLAAEDLRSAGFVLDLNEPDPVDALGGVVDIEPTPGALPVQLVNFLNSTNATGDDGRRAALAALESASELVEGSPLPVVGLHELVALKLYAWDCGSPSTRAFRDARELVRVNAAFDLAHFEDLCARVGLARNFRAFRDALRGAPGS